MPRDLDNYRGLYTSDLLLEARERGIDPYMAIALAERLDEIMDGSECEDIVGTPMGGRYTFNDRSKA